MTSSAAKQLTPDPHQDLFSRTTLGLWIYLMSDCILFASLFATYAVLHNETFGGPSGKELFSLSTAFSETLVLLFSSITCGFALLSACKLHRKWTLFWLFSAFLLGISFVSMEFLEFSSFVEAGFSWKTSAFLSSFFALVGTHGTHVSFGLLWLVVLFFQILTIGLNQDTFRRLVCFSLFWHFLDLVWIFIFTFVYLIGKV